MAVWVRRKDLSNKFEAIPYQDASRLVPQLPVSDKLYEAFKRVVHVIKADGQIMSGGRATLFILEQIGWSNGIIPRVLQQPPLIFFVELGYRIVARNRSFFSRLIFRE